MEQKLLGNTGEFSFFEVQVRQGYGVDGPRTSLLALLTCVYRTLFDTQPRRDLEEARRVGEWNSQRDRQRERGGGREGAEEGAGKRERERTGIRYQV